MAVLKPNQIPKSDRDLVSGRHEEWSWYRYHWRWLLDSLEGGNRYRDAVYGTDTRGMWIYNLVRHKLEYPEPREIQQELQSGLGYQGQAGQTGWGLGSDPTFRSTDDDFEFRRARTPIPNFVEEAISAHLGTVYSKEISRKGLEGDEFAKLRDWMVDVDGKGTSFDTWMQETFAPIFLALGQLDLKFDHPCKPNDAEVQTEDDLIRLGLDRCIVQYILPECLTWWRIDPVTGLYLEVTVWECANPDQPGPGELCWHWTIDQSRALDKDAQVMVDPNPHPYGLVPIVRLFDKRKTRAKNVGHSRYETTASGMKEYYNRDSELTLSDSRHAHPLLQGPEDYVQADGTIPIGPNWLLPKKKNQSGTTVTYEGFDVVDFPKDGAESIRKNKDDIRAEVDRSAHLAKPAGANGPGTVGQSGVSKIMDSQGANRYLAGIATSLARCERTIFSYALRCLLDRPDVSGLMAKIDIVYPTDYDLQAAQDLGAFIGDFQDLLEQSGNAPNAEIIALSRYFRAALPGLDDETYRTVDQEIEEHVQAKAKEREEREELAEMAPQPPSQAPTPPGMLPASPDDETVEDEGNEPPTADE